MLTSIRLAGRLVAGGGRAAQIRICLMTVSLVLLSSALLIGAAIPRALNAQADRAASRAPTLTQSEPGTFQAQGGADQLGLRPLLLLRLRPAAHVVPPRAAAPPGCSEFPAEGHSCVSPELAALAAANPAVARRFGIITEVIRPTGLATPDELIAYVGVGGAGDPRYLSNHWGSSNIAPAPLVSVSFATIVLILLVGGPGLLLFITCVRLSATSRASRTRSLRLIGASHRSIAAVAASDGWIAGVASIPLVGGIWALVNSPLAASNLAGFRWFDVDTRLDWRLLTALLVLVPWLAGRLCRVGVKPRRNGSIISQRSKPAHRGRILLPWAGLIALTIYFFAAGSSHRASPVLFLLAAALTCGGVLIALRPAVEWGAGALAGRAESVTARLSLRRLEFDSVGALRMVTGLAAVVLVATVGTAVGRDVQLAVRPPAATVDIQVAGSLSGGADSETPARYAAIAALPSRFSFGELQMSHASAGNDAVATVQVYYLPCSALSNYIGAAIAECRDGTSYRITDVADTQPSTLRPGDTLQVAGTGVTMKVPTATLDVGGPPRFLGAGGEGLVVTLPAPVAGWRGGPLFTFAVPAADPAVLQFENQLAAVDPDLTPQIPTSGEQQAVYQATDGILRLALTLGFLLGAFAFAVAAVDRSVERRREVAALTAIGISRRMLQRAQIFQVGMITIAGLGAAVVAGQLVGQAYLRLGEDQKGWYWPSLWVGLSVTAVGTLLAASTGLIVFGRRISAELISN